MSPWGEEERGRPFIDSVRHILAKWMELEELAYQQGLLDAAAQKETAPSATNTEDGETSRKG